MGLFQGSKRWLEVGGGSGDTTAVRAGARGAERGMGNWLGRVKDRRSVE